MRRRDDADPGDRGHGSCHGNDGWPGELHQRRVNVECNRKWTDSCSAHNDEQRALREMPANGEKSAVASIDEAAEADGIETIQTE
jgi:hypothetical protein